MPVRFVPIDLDERSRTSKLGAAIDDEFIHLQGSLVAQKIRYIEKPENSVYWGWYPDKNRDVIKLRQAQVGAGQWRPLGRMAYCENQNLIETGIRDALRELDSLRFKGEQGIDVILVSSLAGGTGSGTLLDVSYFLQSKGATSVSGYIPTAAFLLLPRIFQANDVAHRTDANSYAALKELACFYRQQKDFEIHYPMRAEPFYASAGSVIPYSNIFLFDSQLPGRTLASPEECFEYMGNMMFLRMVTEVKSQARSIFSNEAYPARKQSGGGTTLRESGFLFSACSGALFILPTAEEVAELLFKTAQQDISDDMKQAVGDDSDSINEWREHLRHDIIFQVELLDPTKISTQIARTLSAWIANARRAIDEQSVPALQAACELIMSFDWEAEIDQIVVKQLVVFRDSLIRAMNRLDSSLEDEGLKLSTFARRTRVARLLLEERLLNLGVQSATSGVNPAIEVVGRLKSAISGVSEIRELGLPWRKPTIPTSVIAPIKARPFLMRGLSESRQALTELESILSTTGASEFLRYVQYRADLGLRRSLEKLIQQRGQESQVIDCWLSAFDALKDGDNATPQTGEDIGVRRPLNIASISPMQVVEGIQTAKLDLVRRLDEEAMRAISRSRDASGTLTPPSKPDDLVRELLSQLQEMISADVKAQSISMSQESIDQTLDEILGDSKIELFENYITNPCQEGIVFYFRPLAVPFLWKSADLERGLDSRIKQRLRQVFQGAQIEVGESLGSYIAVYHETHYHPAANISTIVQLHQAYQAVSFPAACLHVNRDYAMLDNLLDSSSAHEVRCGNSKCEFNIIHVPRDVKFCPSCNNSILNRCGNLSCNIDNLLEKLGGPAGINETRTMCPGCNQRIQSFWWYCPIHSAQWREKGERYCLRCNEAVADGRMKFSEKSVHDKGRRWEEFCIHCKETNEGVSPFTVPIPELYFDVPKHKVPLLLSTLEKAHLDGNLCPTCGSHLFPECPHGNGHRHFVVRNPAGRMICNNYDAHGESMVILFQCLHCDYPLMGEETKCSRCGQDLVRCPNCTDTRGYLIPRKSLTYDRNCPVCGYEALDVQE